MAWNEIVFDGQAYNELFSKRASETIRAFWYPLAKTCGKKCKADIYAARDTFVQKYGAEVPVIVIDVNNGSRPFMAADRQDDILGDLDGELTMV
jgi:hypothetical protein